MKWPYALLVVVVLAAFVVFYVRSRGAEMAMSADLDRTIVQSYVQNCAKGAYEEAYSLLSTGYRAEVSLADFKEAHEKRRLQKGTIGSCRLLRDQVLRTLFSTKRDVLMMYELFYGDRRETAWIKLEEEQKGRFFIEGTYRENAGETLDFVLW